MSVRLSSWIIVRCIVQFLLLEECSSRDLQITAYCSCAIPYKCVLQSRSQVHVTLVQRNGRPLGIRIEFAARHSSGTLSKQRRQRQRERHQTKGLMSRTNKFPRAKTKSTKTSSKSTPLYQERTLQIYVYSKHLTPDRNVRIREPIAQLTILAYLERLFVQWQSSIT